MKSEKAITYLNHIFKPMSGQNKVKAYNRDMVCKAIEIAEQEMREKAIQAFKFSCRYDIGCAGANRRCNIDECMDLKAFINELNHEENNV